MALQDPVHHPDAALWQDFPQVIIGAAIAQPHVQHIPSAGSLICSAAQFSPSRWAVRRRSMESNRLMVMSSFVLWRDPGCGGSAQQFAQQGLGKGPDALIMDQMMGQYAKGLGVV